jgi:hypothetical protein
LLSYRENLARIGIGFDSSVSYRDFYSVPQSLRQAIRSMDAPVSEDWHPMPDIFLDEYWTDEVQGVAWDGQHWIFSTNANQKKPNCRDKAIYVFKVGSDLKDNHWVNSLPYKDISPPSTKESHHHWGQPCYFEGSVYVSHFWQEEGPKPGQGNVVVFKDNNGVLEFDRWIELEKAESPRDLKKRNVEFQAINPWDGKLYACFGGGNIHEFFLYDMDGRRTDQIFSLEKPVKEAVQGACFSPNGHLFIATGT